MAVGFDAASESHTGTTGSVSAATFSWTHAGGAGPKGALVAIMNSSDDQDIISGVTINSVAMTAVSGGAVGTPNTGEQGYVKWYHLGTYATAGNVTVEVTRTNNTNELWAVSITTTAGGGMDTAVHTAGIVTTSSTSSTFVEQSVDDGSPGTNSMRFGAAHFGHISPPAAGANSTMLHSIDYGARGGAVCRETTAGQGSRSVGFSVGGSDDVAAVYFAVKETAAAGGSAFMKLAGSRFSLAGHSGLAA